MFNTNSYDDEDLKLCEEYSIDIEAGEVLTEFATSKRDFTFNISIAVNPDNNRNLIGMEYFKIYNHSNPTNADKMARIKFRAPEYVIHKNRKNVDTWYLNSKEIRNMITVLKSPSSKYPGYTVWQALILDFNYETGLDYNDTKKNMMVDDKLLYPNYLPIDLIIPDYQNFLFKLK